jgi:DNA-binding response OmpR family regulator
MSVPPAGPSTAPRGRVLLVENDYLIAQTMGDQLDELGYTVVGPAHSLAEACLLAADAPIEAAMLDWNLDRHNAGPVAAILAKRKIPFAFVTGYSEIADAQYRDIPLLNKPFSIEALAHMVEKMMQRASESAP